MALENGLHGEPFLVPVNSWFALQEEEFRGIHGVGETCLASHGNADMQNGEFNSILTQASPSI